MIVKKAAGVWRLFLDTKRGSFKYIVAAFLRIFLHIILRFYAKPLQEVASSW